MNKYVGSLHYRAVELFYGFDSYGSEIDIWSLGCLFAEMIRGFPSFNG